MKKILINARKEDYENLLPLFEGVYHVIVHADGVYQVKVFVPDSDLDAFIERIKPAIDMRYRENLIEVLSPDFVISPYLKRAEEKVDLGEVTEDAFPPCIREMLSQVANGTNLAHTARFALTTFLLAVGMSVDEVVGVFNTSPDFDEERTRYQVDHISGKGGTSYRPPSCATMATYGNCPGEDRLCKWVNHPLSYYERKLKRGGGG